MKKPSCEASLPETKRENTHLELMLAEDYSFLDKLPGTLARTFAGYYISLNYENGVKLKNVSSTQVFLFSSLEKTDDKIETSQESRVSFFSTGCTLLYESFLALLYSLFPRRLE